MVFVKYVRLFGFKVWINFIFRKENKFRFIFVVLYLFDVRRIIIIKIVMKDILKILFIFRFFFMVC